MHQNHITGLNIVLNITGHQIKNHDDALKRY